MSGTEDIEQLEGNKGEEGQEGASEPTGGNGAGGGNESGGSNGDAHGKPDASKAAEKYKQQRDEANSKAKALQKQLDDLMAKGDIEKLKAKYEADMEELEAKAKKAESDRVNATRLAAAGCIDIDVALELLDENGDVDALKKSKSYLFGTAALGSTGLKPDGAANDKESRLAEARKMAGVRKPKE